MKWINYNLVCLFVKHESQNKTFSLEKLSVMGVQVNVFAIEFA